MDLIPYLRDNWADTTFTLTQTIACSFQTSLHLFSQLIDLGQVQT